MDGRREPAGETESQGLIKSDGLSSLVSSSGALDDDGQRDRLLVRGEAFSSGDGGGS